MTDEYDVVEREEAISMVMDEKDDEIERLENELLSQRGRITGIVAMLALEHMDMIDRMNAQIRNCRAEGLDTSFSGAEKAKHWRAKTSVLSVAANMGTDWLDEVHEKIEGLKEKHDPTAR